MKNFYIHNRRISSNDPPLVIAEVGINHEGNINKAFKMIDAAKKSGAEAIKFQCHITEKEMIYTDMTPGKISKEKLWNIIKRCELTEQEEKKVQQYCKKKKIFYFSTPFSKEAAYRLNKMNVPIFKIGSGECNNLPLIDYISSLGKPIILSTGMNNIKSIKESIKIIRKYKVPFALMHCTSMYPTPYNKVRLGAIKDFQKNFPNVPLGLSDHSENIWTCLGAVSLGACLLEKHFTISRKWPGPDTAISIEPDELKDLIIASKAIWESRGGKKDILKEEKPVIDFAYATVVSISSIRKGEIFSKKNIWVKRPGTGKILADKYNKIIGKKCLNNIRENQHIHPKDVEEFYKINF